MLFSTNEKLKLTALSCVEFSRTNAGTGPIPMRFFLPPNGVERVSLAPYRFPSK